MFYKKDNVGLFEAICDELGLDADKQVMLAKSKLDEVTKLEINHDTCDKLGVDSSKLTVLPKGSSKKKINVQSLKGIEQLANLQYFAIFGDNLQKYAYLPKEEVTSELVEKCEKYRDYNQVTDYSPLRNCPKLQQVVLFEQHKAEFVDLGNCAGLVDVRFLNCGNLKTVSGLNDSAKTGTLKRVYFDGCDNLRCMLDEKEFFVSLRSQPELFCSLPPSYAISLLKRDSKFAGILIKSSQQIEFLDSFALRGLSAEQMVLAYDKLKKIENEMCAFDESPKQQFVSFYRFFCDTKERYPIKSCDDETAEQREIRESVEARVSKQKIYESCIALLLGNYGNELGCAGTLNLCGQYLGVALETYLGKSCDDEKNVAVSRLKYEPWSNEKPNATYFDLFRDLGSEQSEYFDLTHEQLVAKGNFEPLSVNDSGDYASEDIQGIIKDMGYLVTSAYNKTLINKQNASESNEKQMALQ